MKKRNIKTLAIIIGAGFVILWCMFKPPIDHSEAETLDNDPIYLPIIMRDYDSFWNWGSVFEVELLPTPNHSPIAIIDKAGRLHLLWDTYSSPRFIYHTILDEQGWTTPTPIAQTLGTSTVLLPPLVDANGIIHLVWQSYLGYGIEKPRRLMYANFDGTQWNPEEEVYRSENSSIKGIPQLDTQGSTRIVVVDDDFLTTRAYQFEKTGGIWISSSPIKPTHSTSWIWPDMEGGIRFFGDNFSNTLYYSYWREGQFEVIGQQISGKVSGRQTQLDGINDLHVYWLGQVPVPGGDVNGLYYQCLDSNLVWREQSVLTGQNGVAGLVKMATDNSSRVALAWEYSGANQFWVNLREGCSKISQIPIPFPTSPVLDLQAIAISKDPREFCAVAKQQYISNYYVHCADIER